MTIAVLGAGAGGAAVATELTNAGHSVALWSRAQETIAPFQAAGGINYEGVLGSGLARVQAMTSDLARVLSDADVAVVTLPTFSHAQIARAIAQCGWPKVKPVILNPGHTGGALEFAQAFRSLGFEPPPIVEFSTLTHVARKYRPNQVTISGQAKQVRAAALPGGEEALAKACAIFAAAAPVGDVLAADLANVNMVLHPPGAVLAAAWVEARDGDFTFYVDAMTEGVARVMRQLDDERRAVAAAFGHQLPNLIEEMILIGTVEADVADVNDFRGAIAGGKANKHIKAPNSLQHRYYREDFGHGLLPFLELAAIADVRAPAASASFDLGQSLCGIDFRDGGRTRETMGIEGLTKSELLMKVRRT